MVKRKDENMINCRICKNSNVEYYNVREYMFNTFEEFSYFVCVNCHTLQIKEIPSDISKYYPKNYYSYSVKKNNFKSKLKNYISRFLLKNNTFYKLVDNYYHIPENIKWLKITNIKKNDNILDIGCGSGELLKELKELKYKNLLGYDKYVEEIKSEEIIITKNEDVIRKNYYSLVMLHHSLEHMENPLEEINKIKTYLSKDGLLLIRIPILDCHVWNKYKEFWVQIDAPRHFYIFSKDTIINKIEEIGFDLISYYYDSTKFQFEGTFNNYLKYNKFIEKIEIPEFLIEDIKKINNDEKGDQICLIFKLK